MALELYWGSGSPYSWRVQLALEYKRVPYESHLLQFEKQEHKSPQLLRMNPRGRVPVLKDGDFVVFESLACLLYLDRRYPDPPIFGRTPEEAGTIMRVICEYQAYAESQLTQIVSAVFFENMDERVEEITRATHVVAGEARTIDWAFHERMRARLDDLVPVTKGLGLRRIWAATIEYTPDHLPILGPALMRDGTEIRGVTVASPGGHGMMWGPGLARVAADLALRGVTDVVDVTDLGLDRFDEHGVSRLAPDPIALPFPVSAGGDEAAGPVPTGSGSTPVAPARSTAPGSTPSSRPRHKCWTCRRTRSRSSTTTSPRWGG